MPKLKFLDAKMIAKSEWSLCHLNASEIAKQKTQSTETSLKMDRMSLWRKIFRVMPKEQQIDDDASGRKFSPLPSEEESFVDAQTPKCSYTRVKHYYKGNESQGNRFIGNTML